VHENFQFLLLLTLSIQSSTPFPVYSKIISALYPGIFYLISSVLQEGFLI